MEKLTAHEIAQAVGGQCRLETAVDQICTDTRTIKPGCLFIPLRGERFDGHDYLYVALEGGAALALSEHPSDDPRIIAVKDTRKALLDLAAYYRSRFAIRVAGITGSVGKTTTKEMVYAVLNSRYATLKNEGNLNNEIGLPLSVFRLEQGHEAAVLEMGMNHFGEISRLTRVAQPTLAMITNIGVSHIEYLGSREGILKAKLEILEGMAPDAPLILNADNDLLGLPQTARKTGRTPFYVGVRNPADVTARDIRIEGDRTRFLIRYNGADYPVCLPAIGEHNILNALFAFSAGIHFDIPPAQAAQALSDYVPSGMRQKIVKKGPITIVEDCYNASPDSMRAALSALMALEGKRRIAVFGDMLELGELSEQAHRDVGRMAGQSGIDALYTFGPQMHYCAEEAEKQGLSAHVFDDKSALFDALYKETIDGDVLLFKGSRGMKLEEVIKGFYERWKDK